MKVSTISSAEPSLPFDAGEWRRRVATSHAISRFAEIRESRAGLVNLSDNDGNVVASRKTISRALGFANGSTHALDKLITEGFVSIAEPAMPSMARALVHEERAHHTGETFSMAA